MNKQFNSDLIDKWYNFHFQLNTTLLPKKKLRKLLIYFLKKKLTFFQRIFIIIVQFKVKTINNLYKSISHVQMDYIKNDKDILNMFLSFWSEKYETFYSSIREDEYDSIIFSYKILSNDSLIKPLKYKKIIKKNINSKIKIEKIDYDLPNTMDFHLWGEVIHLTKTRAIVRRNSKSNYFINI